MPRFPRSNSAPAADPRIQTDIRTFDGIEAIDELFRAAGLVRGRRGRASRAEGVRPGSGGCSPGDRAVPENFHSPAGVPHVAANGVHWFPVPGWERFPWLWHGFSTRKGGLSRVYCAKDDRDEFGELRPELSELNLGFTPEDARETVVANRRLLAEAVTGNPDTPLIPLRQFHSHHTICDAAQDRAFDRAFDGAHESAAAKSATGKSATKKSSKADGHITDQPGLLLAIQTADCIPVLVADRKRRVVAAFHAGWRGTVQRIVETGIGLMRLKYGSRPEDIMAAIGPGVAACCYSIGEEVFSEFESQFLYARELFHEVCSSDVVRTKYPMLFLNQRAPGHSPIGPSLHLDLVEANRRQLLDAGIKPRAIRIVPGCTSCETDLFFSHRASKGRAGRMMAVIGIRGR